MRGVNCDESDSKTVQLGPTVYADLEFEGCRVNALVDTGSPATIVSLDFLLDSLTKGRAKEQTPTEWKSEVRRRLKPPEVTLHSYGGGGLDIVGQILVTLRCGSHHHTAVVLVQKQAPEALLLGTDLQLLPASQVFIPALCGNHRLQSGHLSDLLLTLVGRSNRASGEGVCIPVLGSGAIVSMAGG